MLRPEAEHALIIGPYSCLWGWEEALRSEGETDIMYLTGPRDARRERLQQRGRWCLMNKEGAHVIREVGNYYWDAVVVDESRFIANPRSRISKYIANGRFKQARFRAVLTGTPATEDDMEYFQQLKFVDTRILGYDDFYDWRHDCFHEPVTGYKWRMKLPYKAQFAGALARNCLFMKRSDVRDLEEKVYMTRKLELPHKLREAYNKAEKTLILECGEVYTKTLFDIVAWQWLRQMSSGIVDGELVSPFKVNALTEWLTNEIPGQQAVIWCWYKAEIQHVVEALSKLGPTEVIYGKVPPEERERIRQRFNSGQTLYTVGQPHCFKFGTDLGAADWLVYFASPDSAETRIQSEDRIISMLKNRTVGVVDFVTENTVEDLMFTARRDKMNRIDSMNFIVRSILEGCNG